MNVTGIQARRSSIVLVVLAVALLCASALADSKYLNPYDVSNSGAIGQGGGPAGPSGGGPATDLHLTYQVSNPTDHHIISFNVTTSPNLGIPQKQWLFTDSRKTGVKVDYYGINVTYTSKVKITEKMTLGAAYNVCPNSYSSTKKWTYSGGSIVAPAVPDHSWDFSTAVYGDEFHYTEYTFRNDDDEVTIILNTLDFYHDSSWVDDQWNIDLLGDLIHQVAGPVVLGPGDSIIVTLDNIPNFASNYIYVAGEMEYQMTDPTYDYQVMEFRNGHEELRQDEKIPSITMVGAIGLILLIIISSIWIAKKRRRTVLTGR